MSSAKSSSWLLDKGPGAETVAVPNFVSVGAVNHRGKPSLWRYKLAFPADLWPQGQPLFQPPHPHPKEVRISERGKLITLWYAWGPSIKLHNYTLDAARSGAPGWQRSSGVRLEQQDWDLHTARKSYANSDVNKRWLACLAANRSFYSHQTPVSISKAFSKT